MFNNLIEYQNVVNRFLLCSGRENVLRGGFGVYYDLGSGNASSLFGGYSPWAFSYTSLRNQPRKLDLALVSFKAQDGTLEAKFITQDAIVLITGTKNVFAQKESIHIQDLGTESILVMDISRPSPWHQKITDAF